LLFVLVITPFGNLGNEKTLRSSEGCARRLGRNGRGARYSISSTEVVEMKVESAAR
jgi:hypothetical protein